MDAVTEFWKTVENEMTMLLATAASGNVSMRQVSPVRYGDAILMFTGGGSKKYRQMRENPACCIACGMFFAEAEAECCGATMKDENAPLRAAYEAKFPGAFAEGIAFGGRDAEFFLLHPRRLTGWMFPDGVPTPEGIPTVPFEVVLS